MKQVFVVKRLDQLIRIDQLVHNDWVLINGKLSIVVDITRNGGEISVSFKEDSTSAKWTVSAREDVWDHMMFEVLARRTCEVLA